MTPLRRTAGLALLLALVIALAPDPAPGATKAEINAAVAGGVRYLKGRFGNPGGGADAGYGIGPPALAGLALMEAGTPANDPAVRAITAAVRDASYRETQTYQLSLCLLFLDRLGDPSDAPLIQVLAVRLLAGQNGQGGWGYACVGAVPPADEQWLRNNLKVNQLVAGGGGPNAPGGAAGPPAPPAPGPKPAGKLHPDVARYAGTLSNNRQNPGDDNSNTQFAILAVWAARKHGVPVEAALDLIDKRFLATQFPQTGGWPYSGGMGATPGSPSMTCAGLLGLATGVGRREERRLATPDTPKKDPAGKEPRADNPFFNPPPRPGEPAGKKADQPKRPLDARDVAVQRGLANLAVVLNASVRGGRLVPGEGAHGDRDLYFLWSLERVGVIYGIEKIGGVDWYAVGAETLVRTQTPDGSWAGGYGPEVDTSFAVLFLTKSNVARDLSSKVQKDPSATELRSGGGEFATAPKEPAAGAGPGGTPSVPNPLPSPVEDESTRLAAQLVLASGDNWTKSLDRLRDTRGGDYTRALVLAIHKVDGDKKKQARDALAERLTRMTADTLRGMMKSEDAELRRAAVLAAAMKDDKAHVPDLIDRLTDDEELVVRAAKAGLKSLTGQDLGPPNGATKDQRKAAADAWRNWWAKQK